MTNVIQLPGQIAAQEAEKECSAMVNQICKRYNVVIIPQIDICPPFPTTSAVHIKCKERQTIDAVTVEFDQREQKAEHELQTTLEHYQCFPIVQVTMIGSIVQPQTKIFHKSRFPQEQVQQQPENT